MKWLLVYATTICSSPCGPADLSGLSTCLAVLRCKTVLDSGRVMSMPDEQTCEAMRLVNPDTQCWAQREPAQR